MYSAPSTCTQTWPCMPKKIDEVLAEPMRRITPELLECGNRYIRFIREQPPFPDAESLLAACSQTDDFHETLVHLQPVHARARYRP